MYRAASSYADSRHHYVILDGLRGVAAITVVLFHILETFSGGDHARQIINHGYLAVDFFFLLSGFVIGYAYDKRWSQMRLIDFFKRRLIRLHPMIIIGMLTGAVLFYWQAGSVFPKIHTVTHWQLLWVLLIGCTLIPLPVSMDIRGWNEMHPLDGPAWSLFFEYIANILYALFLRKLSNRVLFILALLAGAALIHLAVTSPDGDLIGGWSLEQKQLRIGFTRLFYPFLAGLFLSRIARPAYFKNAFGWCSLMLIIVLSVPRVGTSAANWMNGLYDSLSVILVFPLIVFIGASGRIREGLSSRVCSFLGNISYPLYIVHYPFIYLFTAWVGDNQASLTASPSGNSKIVLAAALVLVGSFGLAYASLRLYDMPLRQWLTKRFLPQKD